MIEFSPLCLARLKKEKKFKQILKIVDSVHLDIMDGKFVPNVAFKIKDVNNFRSRLEKHVHIMSIKNRPIISKLKKNKFSSISYHFESEKNHENLVKLIRSKNSKAGIVISPSTKVSEVKTIIKLFDRIIIMAVKPGFSGSTFLKSTLKKIPQVKKINNKIEIVIDGGMNEKTINDVSKLGANNFVVCSVIVKAKNSYLKVKELKKIFKNARKKK